MDKRDFMRIDNAIENMSLAQNKIIPENFKKLSGGSGDVTSYKEMFKEGISLIRAQDFSKAEQYLK